MGEMCSKVRQADWLYQRGALGQGCRNGGDHSIMTLTHSGLQSQARNINEYFQHEFYWFLFVLDLKTLYALMLVPEKKDGNRQAGVEEDKR